MKIFCIVGNHIQFLSNQRNKCNPFSNKSDGFQIATTKHNPPVKVVRNGFFKWKPKAVFEFLHGSTLEWNSCQHMRFRAHPKPFRAKMSSIEESLFTSNFAHKRYSNDSLNIAHHQCKRENSRTDEDVESRYYRSRAVRMISTESFQTRNIILGNNAFPRTEAKRKRKIISNKMDLDETYIFDDKLGLQSFQNYSFKNEKNESKCFEKNKLKKYGLASERYGIYEQEGQDKEELCHSDDSENGLQSKNEKIETNGRPNFIKTHRKSKSMEENRIQLDDDSIVDHIKHLTKSISISSISLISEKKHTKDKLQKVSLFSTKEGLRTQVMKDAVHRAKKKSFLKDMKLFCI